MDERTSHAQQPRDERQAAVTEHMGGVETRVQETVDGVKSTVERAMESFTQIQETVDGARAAVEEMLEGVNVALQETVEGVKTMVERIEPAHVNQHPWILLGSAILLGYLLGTLEQHTASSPGQGGSSAERHEHRAT
jgi:ElaB/YqjD/DUF883 family membrane-anchored ribosome-binding protein